MAKVKPRVKVPKTASVNEVVTIKTLISHPMESGQRKDSKTGEAIPRKIINKFAASFNGEPVFMANMEPSVSANPYIEFQMRVPETGVVRFEWTDDDGSVYDLEKTITAA
ncbi:thiosulfate oxidation carrier complex protein SoxZ [Pseudovibrio japonicus]|uniref:Thiosulfate oxidation carrier complex protein SoxZ n=1 Tax=Pseudovibrio japonicus TaxID=366534 RepID=A0ABQ3E4W4_9HYPH|nr:thiosulfate oxidation carrier complex protein SoxZ [Pseudovibrio japonicus]GHB23181.1 thiosulfate oxidation carrier complex protein SoxZ [Pseudovibrio japonicus]